MLPLGEWGRNPEKFRGDFACPTLASEQQYRVWAGENRSGEHSLSRKKIEP